MTDPVTTITVSTIVTLAVQEFIKSGAGELAKKFTAEAIARFATLGLLALWVRISILRNISEPSLGSR